MSFFRATTNDKCQTTNGFTLIEILIALVIMGMFIGGGSAAYRKFNTRQIVVTTGKELLVNLRQAQAKANSGVKTASGCSTVQLRGYRVYSTTGSLGQYNVSENYVSNCASGGVPDAIIKTVYLPSGVAFQSAFSVTFMGLSGGSTLSGASPLVLRLCNKSCGAGSTSYRVAINQAGLIEDQGAQ